MPALAHSYTDEEIVIYLYLRYYREVGVNIGEARDLHQQRSNVAQYKCIVG